MKKVIGYIRVSTDKQADKGLSLEAQRAKIEQYAALYDLDLIGIEIDAGASAKTLNRNGLQRALKALTNGNAEGPPAGGQARPSDAQCEGPGTIARPLLPEIRFAVRCRPD